MQLGTSNSPHPLFFYSLLFCLSDKASTSPVRPRRCEHVPAAAAAAGSERGPAPGQGAHFGQHESQREAGRVRGPRTHRAAGAADREGAEGGKSESFGAHAFGARKVWMKQEKRGARNKLEVC